MAVTITSRPGCIFQRTFSCKNSVPSNSECTKTCREPLYVIAIDRYVKDKGFGIFFPQAIYSSDDLYDATFSDGDCKLRVTIHPSLNPLIEKNELRCGCQLRNVTFSTGVEDKNDEYHCHTYRVVNLQVDVESGADSGLEAFCGMNVDALPWFGMEGDNIPSVLPLRARRTSYLPLWNNQDYIGVMWKDEPPANCCDNTESDQEAETGDLKPTVTIQKIRKSFCHRSRVVKGVLVVRILRKSRLVYYGKAERNCECPYKALLEVGDGSGGATVVLWNTLCMDWYRSLHPGMVLRLSCYRVKESYHSRMGDSTEEDIEISLNSRNPSAYISVVTPMNILPEWHLPKTPYHFYCGMELLSCPLGGTCDVIGLVVFVGRPERVKQKECQGAELWEYRWLRLEDGTTDQPIMVQLFSTSQPEIHANIHPMSILVCTNVRLVRTTPDQPPHFQYLTNTTFTQVYCTGSGHHTKMLYRRLRPVRRFIQWVQTLDEGQVLGRAVIGGFFTFPTPPVSLEQYMKNRNGEPGLVSGSELKREVERLQYRESRRFAIQATVIAVSHCSAGEDKDFAAIDGRMSHSTPILAVCAKPFSPVSPIRLSPRSPKSTVGSAPTCNRSSAKRRLFHSAQPSRKRLTLPLHSALEADPEEDTDRDFSLWDASMEFLEEDEEDEDEDEEDASDEEDGFPTECYIPMSVRLSSSQGTKLGLPCAGRETVPRQFCPQRREVQVAAVGLQVGQLQNTLPSRKLDTFAVTDFYSGHYTLTLRALTDNILVDALFLPASPGNLHWSPHPHPHNNSWEAILSHGGFSASSPPPAPSDLIAVATQLTSLRLVCVLEVCHLGGGRLEMILSRAFPLRD